MLVHLCLSDDCARSFVSRPTKGPLNIVLCEGLSLHSCALKLSLRALVAQKQPFTVETMLKLARIGEPALSPNGTPGGLHRADRRSGKKHQAAADLRGPGGTAARPGRSPGRDSQRASALVARFQADLFCFQPRRIVANLGDGRRWDPIAPDHANSRPRPDGMLVTPDGKKIVFLSSVYPDCGADDAAINASSTTRRRKVKARIYTSLLYRHWTHGKGSGGSTDGGQRRTAPRSRI